ncbi:MAG: hypothetical protein OXG72_11835 [Acidobacteria bacterium]|nr:hypothetical protein [Acidobacteriota bacterium]
MGLTGQLGAGLGRWRLTVSSDRPLQVVNVVVSPTGHWNNLSTTAVRGAAPADRAGFDDGFVGESAFLEVEDGRFALMFLENGRFSETVQTGGMAATSEGGYDYAGLGPDAGRLTLHYDDGGQCRANLYFSSRTRGWFASHCTGGVDPDQIRSGGDWFVGDDEDDDGGGTPVETTYATDDALPGFAPGSDFFSVTSSIGGGVRVSSGRDGWTATMDDGGWIQMRDGTRYTCASAGGCEIVDGTVTRGSVTGRIAGSGGGEIDRFPVFPAAGRPGGQTYTVGAAIDALTLPEATGGNPPLTYSLSPEVPGLSFAAAARRLTGTPTAAGSYAMSYTVTDADGDLYTLHFSIEVNAGDADGGGMTGQFALSDDIAIASGMVYANGRFYVVDRVDGRVYAYKVSGERDAGASFDLRPGNGNAEGIAYADSRFYVVDSADRKVYAYTASGEPDAAADFDLDDNNDRAKGITHASGRLFVVDESYPRMVYAYDLSGIRDTSADLDLANNNVSPYGIEYADGRFYVVDDHEVYAYSISGDRDAMADFDLDTGNWMPGGIAHADGRFYVVDSRNDQVYGYTTAGSRDTAADFDLANDPRLSTGITYANGRLYVLDYTDKKVFAYTVSGDRDSAADFDLDAGTSVANGITYADDRFYVVDDGRDKVYAYSISGDRDSAADFDVDFFGSNSGISYADGRFYVVDLFRDKVYAYTASGTRDAAADFDLSHENPSAGGIAHADGRLFVVDYSYDKTFAYTVSGTRDAAADFDLSHENSSSRGIAHADGRLFVIDGYSDRVYYYPAPSGDGAGTVIDPGDSGGTGAPDLTAESVSVSDSGPVAGASFTLRATVRNGGDASAGATTLRYYRSTNATISRSDTAVGTDSVSGLAASATSAESISLTAPSSAGTYYYGACVDSVTGESDTDNNCSGGVRVTVTGGEAGSYTPLDRWWLFPGGLVNFIALTIGPGTCANVNGANLNGVTYVVHSTKWQRRAGAGSRWEDVPGTERQGRVCSYVPTVSGEYRMVGDITVGGRRGNYSSDTLTVP